MYLTFLINGFNSLSYYVQTYLLYIACMVAFIIIGVLEYHEIMYKVVDDERKVIQKGRVILNGNQ